jgi:ribosomal protein L6P/L9E
MNHVQPVSKTIPRQLKGIGYRVRRTETKPDVTVGIELRFEVGRSHPMIVRLRPGIHVTVDSTGTSLVRSTTTVDARTLGHEADRLRKRRPRSPYTGVGVLRADRVYPPLKSTKKAAKK